MHVIVKCDDDPIGAFLVCVKGPTNTIKRGAKEWYLGVTEKTDDLECNRPYLRVVIMGCVCGPAEAEDAVLQKRANRTGGFERVHADGDEGTSRRWVEDRVVENRDTMNIDSRDDTTV